MKIYVAGPMTGYPEFNFPAFDKAAAELRALGHTVLNPAEMDREHGFGGTVEEASTRDFKRACMLRDFKAIAEVDALYLLEGYEKSSGVRCELAFANYLGLAIYYHYEAPMGDKPAFSLVKTDAGSEPV